MQNRFVFPAITRPITKKILAILAAIFLQSICIFAEENKIQFEQKIEWENDENALEYKVQVRDTKSGKTYDFETENNFVDFTKNPLPAGNYEYKVTAVDFLGRESGTSEWTTFEIIQSRIPQIVKTESEAISPKERNGKIQIPLDAKDIAEDSKVELVNVQTNESVKGTLLTEKTEGGIEATKAEFPKVREGKWKIRITNPSGRENESAEISIIDQKTIDERIAAEKAEQERIAKEAEEKRIEEEKRLSEIEKQRKAEEKAREEEIQKRLQEEKAEQERIAKAEAERKAELEKQKAEEEKRLSKIEKQREAEILKQVQNDKAKEEKERKKEEKEKARKEEIAKAEENEDSEDEKIAMQKKPFYFEAQAGILYSPFNSEFSDGNILPTAGVRLGFAAGNKNRFGLEAEALVSEYKKETDGYKYVDDFGIFGANLVYQRALTKSVLSLNVRAGGNATLIKNSATYSEEGAEDKGGTYGYFGVQGGISFVFTIAKLIIIETGADYYHIFIDGMPTDFVSPKISVGVRW